MSVVAEKTALTIGGYGAKQCPTRTQNDYDPDMDPADQDPADPFQLSIMNDGNIYEDPIIKDQIIESSTSHLSINTIEQMTEEQIAQVLALAREVELVVFDSDRSEASILLREELTHALLENPGDVQLLWNPRLRKWRDDGDGEITMAQRSAEPDLLYRQNDSDGEGAKWGSIDVKFHNPFEGKAKGLTWDMTKISIPFTEQSTKTPWVGTLQLKDAEQLAHYYRALEFHGLAGEPRGGIIGKPLGGEAKIVWINLNDNLYERGTKSALEIYDKAFAHVYAVAEREIARRDDPTLEHLAPSEWKHECKTCPWMTVCHDRLSLADHISLLDGVTPSKLETSYGAGVTTVAAMARLDITTARLVEAGVPSLASIVATARSIEPDVSLADIVTSLDISSREAKATIAILEENDLTTAGALAKLDTITADYAPGTKGLVENIDQARVVDYARMRRRPYVFKARGVGDLVVPHPSVEIHVDMENDKQIYLWGTQVVWHDRDKQGRNKTTVTHRPDSISDSLVSFEATEESEAAVFAAFWGYLHETIALADEKHGVGNVKVFHYTAAEDRCMRHIAEEHVGEPGIPTLDEVNEFLNSDVWVDLYPILTNQLIFPTEDGTLKSLAKYTQFAWRDEDPSGANSILWYQTATGDDEELATAARQRILDYNEDDCKATATLLEWFQVHGNNESQGRKLLPIEEIDNKFKAAPAPRVPAKERAENTIEILARAHPESVVAPDLAAAATQTADTGSQKSGELADEKAKDRGPHEKKATRTAHNETLDADAGDINLGDSTVLCGTSNLESEVPEEEARILVGLSL